jgi:hypothetical protein
VCDILLIQVIQFVGFDVFQYAISIGNDQPSSVGQVIFKVTSIEFVSVSHKLIVKSHHVGAISSTLLFTFNSILPLKSLFTIALDNISICVHVALKICEISHTVSISVQLYALFKSVINCSLASCHEPVQSDNIFRLQLNTT